MNQCLPSSLPHICSTMGDDLNAELGQSEDWMFNCRTLVSLFEIKLLLSIVCKFVKATRQKSSFHSLPHICGTMADDLKVELWQSECRMFNCRTLVSLFDIKLLLSIVCKFVKNTRQKSSFRWNLDTNPDSKVPRTNMGPIWGRHDPGGPHVGPMNIAIWEADQEKAITKMSHHHKLWINQQLLPCAGFCLLYKC